MRTTFLPILFGLLLATPAAAQVNPESKITFGAVAGIGQTWNDESSVGQGFVGGARIDRRLFGTTRAELAADLLLHHREAGQFEADGQTVIVTGALVHRFGRKTAQPYVLVGVLVAHHTGDVRFEDTVNPRNSTDFGGVWGGGIAAQFKERFELGPEFRVIVTGSDTEVDPKMAFWLGIRFGVRF